MPGIAILTIRELQARIDRFDPRYVNDWHAWIAIANKDRAAQFGAILRRWQACRPNRMRRSRAEQRHDAPYLEDLIAESNQFVLALQNFDIRLQASFTAQVEQSLERLWGVFQHLSYHGRARNGLAGVVGISKSVLLLTEGRVGPAFDSEVRRHLQIQEPQNARQWINALKVASADIRAFEAANQCTLQEAVPHQFAGMASGRIYDMALGPGARSV